MAALAMIAGAAPVVVPTPGRLHELEQANPSGQYELSTWETGGGNLSVTTVGPVPESATLDDSFTDFSEWTPGLTSEGRVVGSVRQGSAVDVNWEL